MGDFNFKNIRSVFSINKEREVGDQPSQLYLIFTDEKMQVSDIQHHAPLGKGNHDVICLYWLSKVWKMI